MDDWRYRQVIEVFKAKEIDLSNYHVLIDEVSLDGEEISGACLSSDGNWVCLPVHDEEAEMLSGSYEYKPQCFEVLASYSIWCTNGTMMHLVEIRLLRK